MNGIGKRREASCDVLGRFNRVNPAHIHRVSHIPTLLTRCHDFFVNYFRIPET